MTLDEAIKHAEEVAEDAKLISMMVGISHITELEQKKCADEHRQLAEWLKELKRFRKSAWVITCKECKHRHLDGMIWECPFGLSGGEDFFCAYGAKMKGADDE